ncbi:hypothetical protein SARC_00015 [Sphaeroforma arctica JP610]|uniref:C2H2-type domain-containing protein n=1 Tax=Sphaeroforma arctica JP610 TaxID=667725 RepID=A0A0L0GGB3_9EUKA|nr:hypothetical protein SARC_00015 [Sphaeroforma arctica JP610]KNC87881.1 hypothetical protein SARC_00015 [Sphaeroforma arctica JP610]|eukprot:XP_014161783.1 hypothetical protein SARC_00015 [Sphaeroforma arctica JP610]
MAQPTSHLVRTDVPKSTSLLTGGLQFGASSGVTDADTSTSPTTAHESDSAKETGEVGPEVCKDMATGANGTDIGLSNTQASETDARTYMQERFGPETMMAGLDNVAEVHTKAPDNRLGSLDSHMSSPTMRTACDTPSHDSLLTIAPVRLVADGDVHEPIATIANAHTQSSVDGTSSPGALEVTAKNTQTLVLEDAVEAVEAVDGGTTVESSKYTGIVVNSDSPGPGVTNISETNTCEKLDASAVTGTDKAAEEPEDTAESLAQAASKKQAQIDAWTAAATQAYIQARTRASLQQMYSRPEIRTSAPDTQPSGKDTATIGHVPASVPEIANNVPAAVGLSAPSYLNTLHQPPSNESNARVQAQAHAHMQAFSAAARLQAVAQLHAQQQAAQTQAQLRSHSQQDTQGNVGSSGSTLSSSTVEPAATGLNIPGLMMPQLPGLGAHNSPSDLTMGGVDMGVGVGNGTNSQDSWGSSTFLPAPSVDRHYPFASQLPPIGMNSTFMNSLIEQTQILQLQQAQQMENQLRFQAHRAQMAQLQKQHIEAQSKSQSLPSAQSQQGTETISLQQSHQTPTQQQQQPQQQQQQQQQTQSNNSGNNTTTLMKNSSCNNSTLMNSASGSSSNLMNSASGNNSNLMSTPSWMLPAPNSSTNNNNLFLGLGDYNQPPSNSPLSFTGPTPSQAAAAAATLNQVTQQALGSYGFGSLSSMGTNGMGNSDSLNSLTSAGNMNQLSGPSTNTAAQPAGYLGKSYTFGHSLPHVSGITGSSLPALPSFFGASSVPPRGSNSSVISSFHGAQQQQLRDAQAQAQAHANAQAAHAHAQAQFQSIWANQQRSMGLQVMGGTDGSQNHSGFGSLAHTRTPSPHPAHTGFEANLENSNSLGNMSNGDRNSFQIFNTSAQPFGGVFSPPIPAIPVQTSLSKASNGHENGFNHGAVVSSSLQMTSDSNQRPSVDSVQGATTRNGTEQTSTTDKAADTAANGTGPSTTAKSFTALKGPSNALVASANAEMAKLGEGLLLCHWRDCRDATPYTPADLALHIKSMHVVDLNTKPMPATFSCQWLGCKRGNKPFPIVQQYLRHLQTHTREKPFACRHPGCGQTFTQANCLAAHTRLHTGERPFKCTVAGCTKRFAYANCLLAHTRSHTGEKPRVCSECGKGFSGLSNLTAHMRTHTGERPYACKHDGCGKSFATSSDLVRHARIHSGIKPFKCQYEGCVKAFTTSSQLNNHNRTHTGEKPFQCKTPNCTKRFADLTTLRRHEQIHLNKKRKAEDALLALQQKENGVVPDGAGASSYPPAATSKRTKKTANDERNGKGSGDQGQSKDERGAGPMNSSISAANGTTSMSSNASGNTLGVISIQNKATESHGQAKQPDQLEYTLTHLTLPAGSQSDGSMLMYGGGTENGQATNVFMPAAVGVGMGEANSGPNFLNSPRG